MTKRRLVVLAGLLLWMGCGSSGPELASVSGIVKLDGTPLKEASVEFFPAQGRPSFGSTDETGYYELAYTASKKGVVPGEHTVRVSTHHRGDPDSGTKPQQERIPAKYSGPKSELKKKVEPGSNTIDIDISSKDGKGVQPAK